MRGLVSKWGLSVGVITLWAICFGCAKRQTIIVPTVVGRGTIGVYPQNPEYYPLNEYTVQKCFYEIASTGLRDSTTNCPDVLENNPIIKPRHGATPAAPTGYPAAGIAEIKTYLDAKDNDPAQAKKLRNAIVYGLMTDIDIVYNHEYNNIFIQRSLTATLGDGFALGLGATGAIAAQKATKTIMAALQTAVTGLSTSINKNYFAEQSFQILGMAMGTRRDKIRKGIIAGLGEDDISYPLNQAKRDLISYLQAGTLPAALEELQEEAASASKDAKKADDGAAGIPSGLHASNGVLTNALVWQPVAGASTYTVYWSIKTPVTKQSSKLPPTKANYVLDTRADTSEVYYAVTATVSGEESDLSGEAHATPNGAPSTANATLPAPTNVVVTAVGDQAVITFNAPPNSASFIVKSSPDKTGKNSSTVGNATDNNLVIESADNATKLFYQVIALNKMGTQGTPSDWYSAAEPVPVDKKKPPVSLY